MSKVARFVIWICSNLTRNETEQIINSLLDVLNNRNPEVKSKDDFKEKHPNYRTFSVDPQPPLSEPPQPKQSVPQKDYKELLQRHLSTYGKPLKPIKHRPNSPKVPAEIKCPHCNAPHDYIYYNDGKKMSQLKCKVCNHLFQLNQKFRKNSKTKYYCHHALFTWKVRKEVTIYKCCNDNCTHHLFAINKLNPAEKALLKQNLLSLSSAISSGSITTNLMNYSI